MSTPRATTAKPETSLTGVPPAAGTADPARFAANAEAKPEISIRIMSNPLYLSGTREMIAGVTRRFGFGEEVCSQIALAVDEALCNVIRHGYGRAADRPIWISLHAVPEAGATGPWGDGCMPESIRIVIEDEARQVDPSIIKSRDLDEIRPGGLGVHIIQTVMDSVSYEHRSGAGMKLTMTKRRQSSPTKLGCSMDASSSGSGGCCDCGSSGLSVPKASQEKPHGQ